MAVLLLGSIPPGGALYAKHKSEQADPDDATSRLFQLLDSAREPTSGSVLSISKLWGKSL